MGAEVAEDMGEMENNRRFKHGRESGRFDNWADLDSDIDWLTDPKERPRNDEIQEISFQEIDPIYVKGYETGYEEGPSTADKKRWSKKQ